MNLQDLIFPKHDFTLNWIQSPDAIPELIHTAGEALGNHICTGSSANLTPVGWEVVSTWKYFPAITSN